MRRIWPGKINGYREHIRASSFSLPGAVPPLVALAYRVTRTVTFTPPPQLYYEPSPLQD